MYSMRRTLNVSDSDADDNGSCSDAGSDRSISSPQHEGASPASNPHVIAYHREQSRLNESAASREEETGISGTVYHQREKDNEGRRLSASDIDCLPLSVDVDLIFSSRGKSITNESESSSVFHQQQSQVHSRGATKAPRPQARKMVSSVASSCLNPTEARIIDSPLLHAAPTRNRSASEAGLVSLEDRWQAMAQLAGDHRQDPRILDLTNRALPPEALKFGVPPKVAAVVKEFRYDGNRVGKHDLPSFLDLMAQLFPKLKRISLKGIAGKNGLATKQNRDEHEVDPVLQKRIDSNTTAAESEAIRMRRLYILYRLPNLDMIDDVAVSQEERSLARPSSPSGCPVRKDDWLTMAINGVNSVRHKEGNISQHHFPPSRFCDNHGPTFSNGREDLESNPGSAVEVSFCGLINYVRSPKRPSSSMVRTHGERSREMNQANVMLHRCSQHRSNPQLQTDEICENPKTISSSPPVRAKGVDQANLTIVNAEKSTDLVRKAIDDNSRDSRQKQDHQKMTIIDASGEKHVHDTDGTNSKRNLVSSTGKVPFRGSRPPPSPASKIRLPIVKERRRTRTPSRKLWRQRKAATSMLDREENCTDEEESNESDQGQHSDRESDTKEILSSFLVLDAV
mmetsp:Transcript_8898/g.26663  ORF Transcript_8898/g.26663 Transcript_8898/m.26663 type:complete len:625 (-) Transcript_8898:40-1914(-)